jgi:hypothetical protein
VVEIRWDEKAGLRRDAVRSRVIDVLEALAVADVSGDGKLDLIVSNTCLTGDSCDAGAVSVLLGNGDGLMTVSKRKEHPSSSLTILLGKHNSRTRYETLH